MQPLIPNHIAPSMSEMDLEVAYSVPPGGNWKSIPEHIPSQRVKTIRESYKEGKGSRSTYYGRLHPDFPSYTINTYFTRPGNGCHMHYDFSGGQHRSLSYREAARLQSFPDNFVFHGSKTSIQKQIGNAVPPLLAFQIAKMLPYKGILVDLFSGCGGLSLGFSWSGWESIVANDIEESFLQTYKANIHSDVVCGDIRDKSIYDQIVERAVAARKSTKKPVWIIGGPPCQGFSTAGKKRSMEDERNWLFQEYKNMITDIKPDGFVFENVTGLLNMEKGEVLRFIKEELASTGFEIKQWVLHSEKYAIPQRRSRVILVGSNKELISNLTPPVELTQIKEKKPLNSLFDNFSNAVSVKDALDDLPPLKPGEDGTMKGYRTPSSTLYQKFIRNEITANEYLEKIRSL